MSLVPDNTTDSVITHSVHSGLRGRELWRRRCLTKAHTTTTTVHAHTASIWAAVCPGDAHCGHACIHGHLEQSVRGPASWGTFCSLWGRDGQRHHLLCKADCPEADCPPGAPCEHFTSKHDRYVNCVELRWVCQLLLTETCYILPILSILRKLSFYCKTVDLCGTGVGSLASGWGIQLHNCCNIGRDHDLFSQTSFHRQSFNPWISFGLARNYLLDHSVCSTFQTKSAHCMSYPKQLWSHHCTLCVWWTLQKNNLLAQTPSQQFVIPDNS